MDAKFAPPLPVHAAWSSGFGRYAGAIESAAGFLGAVVAGLLLMAPLDFEWTTAGPPVQLDLLILNMPRAAAAGAVLAMVTAALAVVLGRRAAWIAAFGSAAVLLGDHLWDRDVVTTGTLSTVNYVDSICSGILLGALAVAVSARPAAYTAFLFGMLSSILIGDLTALPPDEGVSSLIEWPSSGTPPLGLLVLAVAALAAGIALQRQEPAPDDAGADLPIGPIVAALMLVISTAVATQWFVRHADNVVNLAAAVTVTLVGALIAVLLLPGRDGVLVLLSVAIANAGSAIIAVPRPDWTAPLPLAGVAAGLYFGRRRPSIPVALTGAAALSLFAACTANQAPVGTAVPVIGITGLSLLLGYGFGAALPKNATGTVLALAVLVVPCVVVALRGNSFGRVAYSPRWYRDPAAAISAAPGWTALLITAACAAGILLLHRIRSPRPADN
ncbi:hypothetical protein [Nocardia sp. IFM 10818]